MNSPPAQTPIFVINLDRSKDRLEFISKQMENLGLEWRRVAAVDGRELTDIEARNYTDEDISRIFFRRKINKGELGCHLSHMKIYQIMQDENIEQAVIIEDDAILKDDFPEVLRLCLETPLRDEWQVLHMIPSPEVKLWVNRAHEKNIIRDHYLSVYLGVVYGTVCYAIKRQRAQRLLEQRLPCVMPIDVLLFDMALSEEFAHIAYWRKGERTSQNHLGKINESTPSLIREEEIRLAREMQKNQDEKADHIVREALRANPSPSLISRAIWKLDSKLKSLLLNTVFKSLLTTPWEMREKLHYNIHLSGETRDYYPGFMERMRIYQQARRSYAKRR